MKPQLRSVTIADRGVARRRPCSEQIGTPLDFGIGQVEAGALSPDGTILVTASQDGTIPYGMSQAVSSAAFRVQMINLCAAEPAAAWRSALAGCTFWVPGVAGFGW